LNIDKVFIESVKKGDRKIIHALYRETFNLLMSVAVRYKNNKEDQMTLVNNSFMKIINNIDKFEQGTAFFSWVKRIAQNEIIDEFRRNKRANDFFNYDADETTTKGSVSAEILEKINEEDLLRYLNILPPKTKIVFNLFAIDGYEAKEIAENLDLTYETVKWHIKEARQKLRSVLNVHQKSLSND